MRGVKLSEDEKQLIAADYSSQGAGRRACAEVLVSSLSLFCDGFLLVLALYSYTSTYSYDSASNSSMGGWAATGAELDDLAFTADVELGGLAVVLSDVELGGTQNHLVVLLFCVSTVLSVWNDFFQARKIIKSRLKHQQLAAKLFDNPSHSSYLRFDLFRRYILNQADMGFPVSMTVLTEPKSFNSAGLRKVKPSVPTNTETDHSLDIRSEEKAVVAMLVEMDKPCSSAQKVIRDQKAVLEESLVGSVQNQKAKVLLRSALIEKLRRERVTSRPPGCSGHACGPFTLPVLSFLVRAFGIWEIGNIFDGNLCRAHTRDSSLIVCGTYPSLLIDLVAILSVAALFSSIGTNMVASETQEIDKSVTTYRTFAFVGRKLIHDATPDPSIELV